MLTGLYLVVGATTLGMAALPSLSAGTALLFAVMVALGMGNGCVFQLVPQRFPDEIGVVTGIVGAAGGLGGFVLPTLLGSLEADDAAASAEASSPSRWPVGSEGR